MHPYVLSHIVAWLLHAQIGTIKGPWVAAATWWSIWVTNLCPQTRRRILPGVLPGSTLVNELLLNSQEGRGMWQLVWGQVWIPLPFLCFTVGKQVCLIPHRWFSEPVMSSNLSLSILDRLPKSASFFLRLLFCPVRDTNHDFKERVLCCQVSPQMKETLWFLFFFFIFCELLKSSEGSRERSIQISFLSLRLAVLFAWIPTTFYEARTQRKKDRLVSSIFNFLEIINVAFYYF